VSTFHEQDDREDDPRNYATRDDNVTALRVPPQSIEAEQAVIGCVMMSAEALDIASIIVGEQDFYRRDHQLIFQAITELSQSGRGFDPITISEWFDANGLSEIVAGGSYLIELANSHASAVNVKAYAEIVRDKATLRRLIDIGTGIANDGFSPDGRDTSEIYASHVDALTALSARVTRLAGDSEPLDLFGDMAPPTLMPEHLPPVIARYSYDYAKVMGTAPEIIAFTSLATAASAIHDDFRLQPKPDEPGWLERACLWTMIVADPGSKKSPAMKLALAPLLEIDRDMCAAFGKTFAAFAESERIFKIEQKAADKRKAKAAAGENMGLEDPEHEARPPEKPRQERVFISDATIEAMADLCHDNPRGMTFFRDELAGWFGSMDAYTKGGAAKDRPKWLEAYGGGSMTVDRIGRGTKFIENWSLSVVGSIQPHVIKSMLHKSQDDGLFQRFMICEIPNEHRPEEERSPDRKAYLDYCNAIQGLWRRVPQPDGGRIIRLDEEANEIRREFFAWISRISSSDGLHAMLRGHLSKWTGLWSRLVLTYHCLGCASAGKWPTSVPVSAATVKRVEAMMKRYLLPQAVKFYSTSGAGSDQVYTEARRAASMILSNGVTRLTARELQRTGLAWREMPTWSRQAVITMLTEAGWLVAGDTRRKRASGTETAWTVNPRVHTLYAERGVQERARREATATTLRELREAAAGRKDEPA
jgi:hypothetical protein